MILKDILEAQDLSADTILLDNTFTIPHERAQYNLIRSKYKELSEKASDDFLHKYEKLETIDDLLDSAPVLFIESIEAVLTEILQDIISIGIYDIDKEKVIQTAFEGKFFDPFSDYFKDVTNSCNKIYHDFNIKRQSREQNYQYVGNWTSATIGGTIFDAWSNQLQADAMNLTESLAVAGVNAVLNAASAYEANKKLNNIFKSAAVKNGFIESIYASSFNLHLLLIDLVEASGNQNTIQGSVQNADAEKALAMFHNFSTLNLDHDKQVEFINMIFALDPYQEEYYKYLIKTLGDHDNSISDLGAFFTVNISSIKNELAKDFVKEHIGYSEKDVKQCRTDLNSFADFIGLKTLGGTQAMELIVAREEKLDLEFRTVDGIVFETRDEASLAKEELAEITEIMKQISAPGKDATLSYERDLFQKRDTIDSTYQTQVKESYLKQLDDMDQKFDLQFRKISLIKTTETREEAAKEKAYLFVKAQKLINSDDVKQAYTELEESFLPEVGISLDEAVKATDYLKNIQSEIENGVSQEGFENKKIGIFGDQSINQVAGKAKKGLKGLFKK